MGNPIYLLMCAVAKDQATLSNQQMVDAQTTEMAVKQEVDIYSIWNGTGPTGGPGILGYDVQLIETAIQEGKNPAAAQARYQADAAKAQAQESTADGSVQSGQQQTTTDAQNLQMKAQMAQGVNSILTTLSSLLGKLTA